jgi:hypothetical protein
MKPRRNKKLRITKKKKSRSTEKKGVSQKGGTIINVYSGNSSYNENLYVRESHNCYTYFLNLKNNESVKLCKRDYSKHNMCKRAQPGYFKGYPMLNKNDYNCPTMMKRTIDDNPTIKKTSSQGKCSSNYYKGALVVAPGRDYHYYRLNDDNVWTHKPGYKPSTDLDSDKNKIFDPEKANRNYGGTLNYKDFCGFMCVPKDDEIKHMAHYDDYKNNPNNNKNITVKNMKNMKNMKNFKSFKNFKNFKNYKNYKNYKNFSNFKKFKTLNNN